MIQTKLSGKEIIFGFLLGLSVALLFRPEVRKKLSAIWQEYGEDFIQALQAAREQARQKEEELKKELRMSEEEYPNYIV